MHLIFQIYAIGEIITFFCVLSAYKYLPHLIDEDQHPLSVAFTCAAFWPVVWWKLFQYLRDHNPWN